MDDFDCYAAPCRDEPILDPPRGFRIARVGQSNGRQRGGNYEATYLVPLDFPEPERMDVMKCHREIWRPPKNLRCV